MTERQRFKFAFLMGAARDGLSPEELQDRVADLEEAITQRKAAGVGEYLQFLWPGAAIGGGLGGAVAGPPGVAVGAAGGAMAQHLGPWALPLAVGGAAAIGGGAGHLLAKARESDFDPKAAQRQELIAAYNAYTDKLTHANAARRPAAGTGLRVALP